MPRDTSCPRADNPRPSSGGVPWTINAMEGSVQRETKHAAVSKVAFSHLGPTRDLGHTAAFRSRTNGRRLACWLCWVAFAVSVVMTAPLSAWRRCRRIRSSPCPCRVQTELRSIGFIPSRVPMDRSDKLGTIKAEPRIATVMLNKKAKHSD